MLSHTICETGVLGTPTLCLVCAVRRGVLGTPALCLECAVGRGGGGGGGGGGGTGNLALFPGPHAKRGSGPGDTWQNYCMR